MAIGINDDGINVDRNKWRGIDSDLFYKKNNDTKWLYQMLVTKDTR